MSEKITAAQLKQFLSERNMPTSGLKKDLIERVRAAKLEEVLIQTLAKDTSKVSGVSSPPPPVTAQHGAEFGGPDDDVTTSNTQHNGTRGDDVKAGDEGSADDYAKQQQHQAILDVRIQAIEERQRIQREKIELDAMEFEIRQDREEREFRLKKEREEHEFKLKREFERANQDARAKLMRKRQSLREQVEQLTLMTSTDMKDILGGLLADEDGDASDAAGDVQQDIEVPCDSSTYSEAVEEQTNVDVDKDNVVNAVYEHVDEKLSSMGSDDACAASMSTGRHDGARARVQTHNIKTQDARIVVFGSDRLRTTAPVGSTSTRGTVQGHGDTRR